MKNKRKSSLTARLHQMCCVSVRPDQIPFMFPLAVTVSPLGLGAPVALWKDTHCFYVGGEDKIKHLGVCQVKRSCIESDGFHQVLSLVRGILQSLYKRVKKDSPSKYKSAPLFIF